MRRLDGATLIGPMARLDTIPRETRALNEGNSMPEIADKYDHAIMYLTRNPMEIVPAWQSWNSHPAGCLFAPVIPILENAEGYPGSQRRPDGKMCGCLTEIRRGSALAWTDELTEAIQADNRIPALPYSVRVENLQAFAEFQRRLDRELREPAVRELARVAQVETARLDAEIAAHQPTKAHLQRFREQATSIESWPKPAAGLLLPEDEAAQSFPATAGA